MIVGRVGAGQGNRAYKSRHDFFRGKGENMATKNTKVRLAMIEHKVSQRALGRHLGISQPEVCGMLRCELVKSEQENLIEIIKSIGEEK